MQMQYRFMVVFGTLSMTFKENLNNGEGETVTTPVDKYYLTCANDLGRSILP